MIQPLVKINNHHFLKGIENFNNTKNAQIIEIPKNNYYKRTKLQELRKNFETFEESTNSFYTFKEGYIFKDSLIELMEINKKNRLNETEKKGIYFKSMFDIKQDEEGNEFIRNNNTFLFLNFRISKKKITKEKEI